MCCVRSRASLSWRPSSVHHPTSATATATATTTTSTTTNTQQQAGYIAHNYQLSLIDPHDIIVL